MCSHAYFLMGCLSHTKWIFPIFQSMVWGPWLTLAFGVVGRRKSFFLTQYLPSAGVFTLLQDRWSRMDRSSGHLCLSTFVDQVTVHWWKSELLRTWLFILSINGDDWNRNCTPNGTCVVVGVPKEGPGWPGWHKKEYCREVWVSVYWLIRASLLIYKAEFKGVSFLS